MSPYLVKRGRRYTYRRRMPKDLLYAYHTDQIRISLLTTSRREADKVAGKIDERVDRAFSDIRLLRLTQSEAQALVAAAVEFGGVSATEQTLKGLSEEYERTKGQGWNSKGRQEFWKAYSMVEAAIGNKTVRLLDRVMVLKVRDYIHATGVQPRTVNKYLQRLSSVLNYGVTSGVIAANPCVGVKFEVTKATVNENRYLPYTDEEVRWILEELLEHPSQNRRWSTYMYWLPLLGCFTGARSGDLADLTKDSFIERGGIQCVVIGNAKTGAVPRTVPLHSRLLCLGLMDWVNSLESGAKLFHVPKHRAEGEGEYDYKWYMRRLRTRIKDESKVFHSWRSTLSTRLNDAGVPSVHRADILGHERKSDCETDRTYTSITEIKALSEAIEKLEYPTLDWEKVRLRD